MRVTEVPTVAVELFEGAVNDTAVGATAVTAIVAEVPTAAFESVTLAVSVKLPEAEGVHVTEYGELVTVPIVVVVGLPPVVVTKN